MCLLSETNVIPSAYEKIILVEVWGYSIKVKLPDKKGRPLLNAANQIESTDLWRRSFLEGAIGLSNLIIFGMLVIDVHEEQD